MYIHNKVSNVYIDWWIYCSALTSFHGFGLHSSYG